MLRFKKATLIALNAMLEFARSDQEPLSTQALADRLGISPHHLAKVLQRLTKTGLIRSARGPGGGHRIAQDPKNVTLVDVIGIFEPIRRTSDESPGSTDRDAAFLGDRAPALQLVFDELDEQVYFTLQSISLRTLIAMGDRTRS